MFNHLLSFNIVNLNFDLNYKSFFNLKYLSD